MPAERLANVRHIEIGVQTDLLPRQRPTEKARNDLSRLSHLLQKHETNVRLEQLTLIMYNVACNAFGVRPSPRGHISIGAMHYALAPRRLGWVLYRDMGVNWDDFAEFAKGMLEGPFRGGSVTPDREEGLFKLHFKQSGSSLSVAKKSTGIVGEYMLNQWDSYRICLDWSWLPVREEGRHRAHDNRTWLRYSQLPCRCDCCTARKGPIR